MSQFTVWIVGYVVMVAFILGVLTEVDAMTPATNTAWAIIGLWSVGHILFALGARYGKARR